MQCTLLNFDPMTGFFLFLLSIIWNKHLSREDSDQPGIHPAKTLIKQQKERKKALIHKHTHAVSHAHAPALALALALSLSL